MGCHIRSRTVPGRAVLLLAWLVATGLLPAVSAGAGEPTTVTREGVVSMLERGPGPSRGFPTAALTIIEMSDFQCSYCRKFRWETLPRLEDEYIQAGKIRFVYRHLAVLGQASARAAEAASCAEDQGRFWEYHDKLFEQKGALAFSVSRLKGYGKELGLDTEAFDQCVEARRHADRVERETLMSRMLGASGTPSFLIDGHLLIGAHPFETFQRALDQLLRK